jgi:hypothetical protein
VSDPPVIRKLDFSQFHPLDHSVRNCRGYPGGWRTHLKYRWEFQWEARLRRRLLCPLGRHQWSQWWDHHGNTGLHCMSCFKEKPE